MKNRASTFTIVVMTVLMILQIGCSKSNEDNNNNNNNNNTVDCSSINPGFTSTVLPLIQTKCAINSDCHASGSTNSGGPLTNYAQVSARSSNIRTQVSSGAMPKTGSLTTSEKNNIICWVNNGAANN